MTTQEETKILKRIKAVLAETEHTGKWLAEQLGKNPASVSNGVLIVPTEFVYPITGI